MGYLRRLTLTVFLLAGLWTVGEAQQVWTLRSPLTQSKTINAVVWAGGQFVAVGADALILTSPDGLAWTTRTSPTPGVTLYALTWTGSQLVAVGNGGTILTSTNGTNWTNANNTATTQPLYGVASLSGKIVAVGGGGTILVSNDGAIWTQATSPTSASIVGLAASGSKFLAVSGGNAIQSVDGLNWTSVSTGAGSLSAVTWAVNQFVVTGLNGSTGLIRTSSDGNAPWETRASGASAELTSVVFGSQLVAVGTGGVIRYSVNGESWSTAVSPTNLRLNSVAWSGSRFVAVGANGTTLVSSDGVSWTQTSSVFTGLNTITTRIAATPVPETLVVVGGVGGAILSSTDHATWSKLPFGSAEVRALATSGTTLIASTGSAVYTSTNAGASWTSRTLPTPDADAVVSLAASPTNATVVGVGGGGLVSYSTNGGTNWLAPTQGGAQTLRGVATNGSIWVAVGDEGAIHRTTNVAGNWAAISVSGLTQRLNGITWVPAPVNLFVVVGNNGTVLSSANGTAWTPRPTNFPTETLYSITHTGSQFVAVGAGGTVLTSPNLDDWTKEVSGTTQGLYSVRWDGRQVIAVGAGGTIITSSPSARPPAPTPSYPPHAATGVPVSPAFSWSASSGATSYRVQVSRSATFADTLADSVVTSGTSLTYGPLQPGTKHYWRIRATGATGSSAFSSIHEFTVIGGADTAVSLNLPANNALNVPLNTSLTWSAYTGAVSYRVQVSTDSLFGTTLINDQNLSGTSRLLGGLTSSTKYYWRVSARLNTGITAWAKRSFTTTPPAPATAPVLTTPADSAIGVSRTNASLNWNALAGAVSYHVQFSTVSNFLTTLKDTVITGATTLAVPGLEVNGVYYWRVRAQNTAGSGPFSATRLFTTAVSAPAAPTLVSPANNATGTNVFATVSWNASPAASTYRLIVATDAGLSTRILDTILTGTSVYLGQLSNLTRYYWRVNASNPVGGNFSAVWSFVTGSAPTTPPPAPQLVSPAQFALDQSPFSVALTWQAASTATSYRVQVSTSYADFDANIVFSDSNITGLSKAVGPLTGSTGYFWRVYAKNHLGYGPASEVFNFSTSATLPPPPTLLSPAQFSVDVLPGTVLVWSKAFSATHYAVQVSTSPQFSTFVRNEPAVIDTQLSVSLSANTQYYWRVMSKNSAGTGDASGTFGFRTGQAPLPGTVPLVAPAAFATKVSANPTLSWTAADHASSYHLQVALVPGFTAMIVNDSGLVALSRTVSGLLENTDYYWRVRGKNEAGVGEWAARSFRTDGPTGIVPGRVAFQRLAARGGESIRFGLWRKDVVRIRFFDTQGREIAPSLGGTFGPGYHTLELPESLRGAFFLMDFQAGDYRRTLKMHPR